MSPLSCSARRLSSLASPDRNFGLSCMLGDPRKNCFGLQMHAQWYLSGGHRQMHRALAPLARWVILATGPRAAFMNDTQLLETAPRRFRSSVTLTHPCQHETAYLPCTRPPDALYACRPARLDARDRAAAHAFVSNRSGTVSAASTPICLLDLAPCPRRAISSPGLLATSFGGLHHFKVQHILFADLFPILGKCSLLYS